MSDEPPIVLPTEEDGPFSNCVSIAFVNDKSIPVELRIRKAIRGKVTFTQELVVAARRLYLDGELERPDLNYHVAADFYDPFMIPVPDHRNWEYNPLYPREWPRLIDRDLVQKIKMSNTYKKNQARRKRRRLLRIFHRKRGGEFLNYLWHSKENDVHYKRYMAAYQFPLPFEKCIRDVVREELKDPETSFSKPPSVVHHSKIRPATPDLLKLAKYLGKDRFCFIVTPFKFRSQFRLRYYKKSPFKRSNILEKWLKFKKVRDQGVFNIRDAAREVKKLLQRKNVYHMTDPQCEQEFWDVYRLQMQWLEEDNIEENITMLRENLSKVTDEEFNRSVYIMRPENRASIHDDVTFTTDAEINLKPIVLELFRNNMPLEDIRQVKECIDDMINLTVCQELIPQVATIETVRDYSGVEQHRLKYIRPENELEIMFQLATVLVKNENTHDQEITSPMFALLRTEQYLWSIPLRPFLRMYTDWRKTKLNFKKFRKFSPELVSKAPIDLFKVFLTTNMDKKGVATKDTDCFDYRTASEIKKLYHEEFIRVRPIIEHQRFHRCYTSVITEEPLPNPFYWVHRGQWEKVYECNWKQRVKPLAGRFSWKTKHPNICDLPRLEKDDKQEMEMLAKMREKIREYNKEKEKHPFYVSSSLPEFASTSDFVKFPISNTGIKYTAPRRNQPKVQRSLVTYTRFRLAELEDKDFSFPEEKMLEKNRLLEKLNFEERLQLDALMSKDVKYKPRMIPEKGFLQLQDEKLILKRLCEKEDEWSGKQKRRFPDLYEQATQEAERLGDPDASTSGTSNKELGLLPVWKHDDFRDLKKINVLGSKEYPISSPYLIKRLHYDIHLEIVRDKLKSWIYRTELWEKMKPVYERLKRDKEKREKEWHEMRAAQRAQKEKEEEDQRRMDMGIEHGQESLLKSITPEVEQQILLPISRENSFEEMLPAPQEAYDEDLDQDIDIHFDGAESVCTGIRLDSEDRELVDSPDQVENEEPERVEAVTENIRQEMSDAEMRDLMRKKREQYSMLFPNVPQPFQPLNRFDVTAPGAGIVPPYDEAPDFDLSAYLEEDHVRIPTLSTVEINSLLKDQDLVEEQEIVEEEETPLVVEEPDIPAAPVLSAEEKASRISREMSALRKLPDAAFNYASDRDGVVVEEVETIEEIQEIYNDKLEKMIAARLGSIAQGANIERLSEDQLLGDQGSEDISFEEIQVDLLLESGVEVQVNQSVTISRSSTSFESLLVEDPEEHPEQLPVSASEKANNQIVPEVEVEGSVVPVTNQQEENVTSEGPTLQEGSSIPSSSHIYTVDELLGTESPGPEATETPVAEESPKKKSGKTTRGRPKKVKENLKKRIQPRRGQKEEAAHEPEVVEEQEQVEPEVGPEVVHEPVPAPAAQLETEPIEQQIEEPDKVFEPIIEALPLFETSPVPAPEGNIPSRAHSSDDDVQVISSETDPNGPINLVEQVQNDKLTAYQYSTEELLGEYGELDEAGAPSPSEIVVHDEVLQDEVLQPNPKSSKKRGRRRKKTPPHIAKARKVFTSISKTEEIELAPTPTQQSRKRMANVSSEEATATRRQKRAKVEEPNDSDVSRVLTPEPEDLHETERPGHVGEEGFETPSLRTGRESTASSVKTSRSKRLFLSKNNPVPRMRIQSQAGTNASPTPARRTGVARDSVSPDGASEKLKQLPKSVQDIFEVFDVERSAERGESATVTNLEGPVKIEIEDENWMAPPAITETSRKSKKRLRAEKQQQILDDIKLELNGEPPQKRECEILMERVQVKIEEGVENADCRIVQANFNCKSVEEHETLPLKIIRVFEENEKPVHKFFMTQIIWKEINEAFMTDPEKFMLLVRILFSDRNISGQIYKISMTVTDRIKGFDDDFIKLLTQFPKKLSQEHKPLVDYNKLAHALREKASLHLNNHKITPFTFHGVISNITEMKEKIIGRCEIGMLTDGDRDVLNSTENMLLGAYMKSVLRMTAQSQVSWAHPEYIKRRLEMIYYGWRMFLGSGGFFRVALAINRKDVKPMSQQFRDFFIEYLKDVNENYAKAVELVQMDEDKLMEAMIEKAGLSSIDLLALDEDVQGQVSESHKHKCVQCSIRNQSVYFSSYSLLELHGKLHQNLHELAPEDADDCQDCYETLTSSFEVIVHRINHHHSRRCFFADD
ncbi:Zinc finger protein sdc-3 [Caenorhabditis elegans]|uniref:Zinc finger protein sdc-3 n=1 Tax=Caenorhabditis elegans TaxID=6239 RepID=SDC3_CAEEL|nr:Zinc finger protein sdc-3 [Caenorhabditis elegans]P34706.2 RecName: Full=Zinc finger protein sdc-3 [Caenorhabditis elegans]CAB02774.1 Zinc finger protein sdc-3 [Caenorhabditis elegans]|eukprot:NP_506703.1 Zinc finger protein sdc-3 [Caenorhabditis elegans]